MSQNCILSDRHKTGSCSACPVTCQHMIATNGRIKLAGAPASYRHLTLTNSPAREGQAKAYGLLAKYIETYQRMFDANGERIKSLYLFSVSPGTGKTTTACVALNEYIVANYLGSLKRGLKPQQAPAMFLDVNELQTDYTLATMISDESGLAKIQAKAKRAMTVDFLVIDDIGIRNAPEGFAKIVHMIINARTTADLPTVYTSNIPIGELATVFDARLADRVRDQCAVIAFEGESKRGRR